MRSVQITVFIDHLRLNPDAKFHALLMHTGNKICQTAPQFLFVALPVPKGRIVIISFPEPTVIHHYHINSKGSGFFCQIHNRISRKIEIGASQLLISTDAAYGHICCGTHGCGCSYDTAATKQTIHLPNRIK